MEPKFTVVTRIAKPLAEVFDAVVNPAKITGYFCDKSDGPLKEGQTVHWTWTAKPVTNEVKVKQIVPNSKIVIEWPAATGGTTTVEMAFSTLDDGRTMISFTESGWPANEAGFKASYKNCEGWQHMASCMKAYLVHGIDLRK